MVEQGLEEEEEEEEEGYLYAPPKENHESGASDRNGRLFQTMMCHPDDITDRNVPPKPQRAEGDSHRHTDGVRKEEEGRRPTGEGEKPRIHHYLATDKQYQMEDGSRLRLRLPLLKMTNIFRREMDEIWNPMETDTQSF
ncbi:hypothetical protein EYF80_036159 [Liparis tanakae]|uniref:Uncharacterized protein n=1 Tax=Liparis tanakae TaxID=230148 RepID=A0A4Z2GK00_9TELE|nr:hypothetical protein EYF80_036159 [Liparis tanakae]